MEDLEKILDPDWFEKCTEPFGLNNPLYIPEDAKEGMVTCSLYGPNSFFGSSSMELYEGLDGGYFVRHIWSEPIGDYGTSWYQQWYKSIPEYDEQIKGTISGI